MGSEPSQAALAVKTPSARAGDAGDAGLVPGSGRPPEEGKGSPLQRSRRDRQSHGQRSLVGCSTRTSRSQTGLRD